MKFQHILSYPFPFFNFITLVSALALTAAFVAEFVFDLKPCILCIYQRWPFAIAIGLALTGRGSRHNTTAVLVISALLALTFFVNAALAYYHSGVELGWWTSALEGCVVPDLGYNSPQTMLEQIMSTPSARCDVIPWADPLFGLSMANYNVLFSGLLGLLCLTSMFTFKQH